MAEATMENGRNTSKKYVVARVSDVPPGGRLIVDVGGREVGIFNIDGEFHGVLNRCPHLGGPLCSGELLGLIESDGPGDFRIDTSQTFLVCPWHGWEFDLRTGQSYFDPARTRVRHYPVEVERGDAIVVGDAADRDGRRPGPYVAVKVPITVSDDYLVVTMGAAAGSPRKKA